MKPNFSKRIVKGQEVTGTSFSKKNSDYAPQKNQFFITSVLSPGTGVQMQTSPSWAYSTRHSHKRPELPLKLALLWAKDFQGSLPIAVFLRFISVFHSISAFMKGTVLML